MTASAWCWWHAGGCCCASCSPRLGRWHGVRLSGPNRALRTLCSPGERIEQDHCSRRCRTCGDRPATPAAVRIAGTLQALDATLAGASLREVAEGLFGVDAVAADWHADSALRARAAAGASGRWADARRLSPSGTASGCHFSMRGRFASLQNVPEQNPKFLETASIRSRCVAGLDGGTSHATLPHNPSAISPTMKLPTTCACHRARWRNSGSSVVARSSQVRSPRHVRRGRSRCLGGNAQLRNHFRPRICRAPRG